MQIMNPELEKISLWLYRNHLTLNVLNTHYMVFHKPRFFPPNTLESLFIGASQIERVFDFRCLGVNLDHCLKFKLHIHDVVKKFSKFVLVICKIRDVLKERCLKMLYYSVIYPNNIYCANVGRVLLNLSLTLFSFFKRV